MRKIFYIITIITAFVSCKRDFIEEIPSNQYPLDIVIKDQKTLNTAVNGIYTGFVGESSNDIVNFSELITDNAMLSNTNNGQYSEIYNMTYSPLSGKVNRFWNGMYDIIAKANWVLSYENKLTSSNEDIQQTYKNLFSEARIARAYARLQLVSFFAERYDGDNQDLGIIINDTYTNDVNQIVPKARSTVKESYDAIENDLLYANNNILNIQSVTNPELNDPVVANPKKQSTRFNILAAKVLLSRLYLYERKWDKAKEFAISAEGIASGIAENTFSSPYPSGSDSVISSIFQVAYDASNDLSINSLYSYWGSSGNYKQFFATKEFYDLMSTSDKRRGIYLLISSIYDSPFPYYAKKFGTTTVNDLVLIRKAEIDFNKIEATYYSNPTEALSALKSWVKTNRDSSYNPTVSGADILTEILKQRRIEFAFEGYRFMDLKRNNLGWSKGLNYKGNTPTVSVNDNIQCLPIPIVEMNTNPKMKQNPGYNN